MIRFLGAIVRLGKATARKARAFKLAASPYVRWLSYPVNPSLLYLTRGVTVPRIYMAALSVGIGYGFASFLEINRVEELREFVGRGGTLLLALVASPIAWYVWLIRDRNRLAEFTNTRLGELRTHFYNLQERATENTNPARQSSALFQLRGFLTEDPRLVPDELSADRKRFAELAREFFEMLLKNRQLWDAQATLEDSAESIA